MPAWTAGKSCKIAVVAKYNGEWNKDLSNAITVTPNNTTVSTRTYPTNIKVEHNAKDHRSRFKWDKLEGAEKYGIAVFMAVQIMRVSGR
ncbi:MAG: hypothetical protein K6C68_11340 [Ruminococcus sp.]|nr:hypothetical protein [Ruminococcus sp.]